MTDRAARAMSFGTIAEDYNRYRPGPTDEVVDWLLPAHADTVVDLGAGTGALTRLLVGRVPNVYSVEPDSRMREVLAANNPGTTTMTGRGDAIPLDDGSADAVLVSSAWHWMDVEPTLAEVARVLRPAGRLGIVWAGPDRRPPWVRRLLSRGRATNAIPEIVDTDQPTGPEDAGGAGGPDDAGGADRPGQGQDTGDSSAEGAGTAPGHRFFLPEHSAFAAPEFASIEWSRTMTLDDLVGLAGTFSRVITLPTEERERVIRRARTWLESQPELAQTGQVELPFRAACWRTNRTR